MRRRYKNSERPPRVGASVLAKAFAGVFLIFLSTGAGVAIAGYLMIAPSAWAVLVRAADRPVQQRLRRSAADGDR